MAQTQTAQAVRDVMTPDCECIGENDTVATAAKRLAELNIGSMPICGEDERLKGMLTDRDIVVKVLAQDRDPSACTAGELAQGKPVVIRDNDPLEQAMMLMSEHQIRRLPVINDNKRLCGIVAQADIARAGQEQKVGETLEHISA